MKTEELIKGTSYVYGDRLITYQYKTVNQYAFEDTQNGKQKGILIFLSDSQVEKIK